MILVLSVRWNQKKERTLKKKKKIRDDAQNTSCVLLNRGCWISSFQSKRNKTLRYLFYLTCGFRRFALLSVHGRTRHLPGLLSTQIPKHEIGNDDLIMQ